MGIRPNPLRAIEELGFINPMPIQEKVIPFLLADKHSDIIGLAQTGTGKTAAFGLPLIQQTDTSNKITQHLILAPTRELCLQIADDLTSYAKYEPKLRISAVYGGTSIDRQIQLLKKGAHIISATPGRLLDMLNRGKINISKIKTLVLDEADEMLNMGFRDELEAILAQAPDKKDTLLFSATMPKEVEKIAKRYMNDPVEISVGKRNIGAANVNHDCYFVHAKERYLALKRIVDYYPEVYGIIFCRTRKETQEVSDKLMQDGYNADALHGDLSQVQRDNVMNKFRINHLKLLVATDVAARGLDVDNLTHIINYMLPDDNEVYTHRSGRTGRAGKKGTSIAIANLKEKHKIQQIEKQVGKKFNVKNVPLGKDICEKQLFHLIDRMEKVEVDDSQIESYLPAIYQKLTWLDREELIKKFVSLEFNRFLDYYKNISDLTTPSKKKADKKSRGSSAVGFTRFFINLGRMDNLKPTTLIGLVNDLTGVRDIELGEIEIRNTFSFFEADSGYADLLLKSFAGEQFKKRSLNLEVAEKKSVSERSGKGKKRKDYKSKDNHFDKGRKRKKDSKKKRKK
jgi:ATP-dependent RNA helicase DeaD